MQGETGREETKVYTVSVRANLRDGRQTGRQEDTNTAVVMHTEQIAHTRPVVNHALVVVSAEELREAILTATAAMWLFSQSLRKKARPTH